MAATFDEKSRAINGEIQELADEKAMLQQKIEDAKTATSSLPQRESNLRDLQSDLGKFEKLIAQLEEHEKLQLKKIETRHQTLETKQAELATMKARQEELKTQVDSQELSVTDVQRIAEEKARAHEALATASSANESIQQSVWELDMEATKIMETVTKLIAHLQGSSS